MIQCFIFINNLEDSHCVGVKFYSKTGKLSEPINMKLDDCSSWQAHSQTTIIINTNT